MHRTFENGLLTVNAVSDYSSLSFNFSFFVLALVHTVDAVLEFSFV